MRRLACLLVAAAFAAVSCSGDDDASGPETGSGEPGGIAVLADPSLARAFQELAPDVAFTFAGHDELAAAIREGEAADVYASAGRSYTDELFAEGFLQQPQIFALNRLVVVVPSDNPAGIESVEDLSGEGVTVAIGAAGVPVGDHTRSVLETMGAEDVLENVVSNEQGVDGILDKVDSGGADAGFVYFTDAKAAGDDVQAIELPAQPLIEYPIAVVTETADFEAAEAFIELVLGEQGRQALEDAGFGLP